MGIEPTLTFANPKLEELAAELQARGLQWAYVKVRGDVAYLTLAEHLHRPRRLEVVCEDGTFDLWWNGSPSVMGCTLELAADYLAKSHKKI